jgi:exoribonuclease-2
VNLLYLESGALKVGRVLKEAGSSYQVQSQFGKKIKVKANHVFFFFDHADPDEFFNSSQELAKTIDPDLLWEAFDGVELDYSVAAKVFYGDSITKEQEASVLKVLFDYPTHFYKKGHGNFKPATPDSLRSAKASLRRKKEREILLGRYVQQLCEFVVPEEFVEKLPRLLFNPDKTELEEKAIEQACGDLKIGRRGLLSRLSVMPKPEDFHLGQFVYDQFANTPEHRNNVRVDNEEHIPAGPATAFSIDDASTTEIDDAFTVTENENGGWRLGIHIAAPGFCIKAGSLLDEELRSRMSTVYHPAGKLTMSPPKIIEQFSLSQGNLVPVVSFYADVDSKCFITNTESRIETLEVKDNLDLAVIDEFFDPDLAFNQTVDCPRGRELYLLYRLAIRLRELRGENHTHIHRKEYSFDVQGGLVTITPRKRGSPVDLIVSELMIFANSSWGKQLKNGNIAAMYRVKTKSKTGLSTEPLPHETMGLDAYAWISSPLRRYVDLVNQRQLISHLLSYEPTYSNSSNDLSSIICDFETKYAQYADFQRSMERFWCLKWLQQTDQREFEAEVLRENLVRLDSIPLVCKANNMPETNSGGRALIRILDINLFDNFATSEWIKNL